VQAIMILRMAGVSIPPQLMREPDDRGYRGNDPIIVSVSAERLGVKVSEDRWYTVASSPTLAASLSTLPAAAGGNVKVKFAVHRCREIAAIATVHGVILKSIGTDFSTCALMHAVGAPGDDT